MPKKERWWVCCVLLFIILFVPQLVKSQDIIQVSKGVVKITAQVDGKKRVGSGVVVRLDKYHASIVTASNVIEGDLDPNVFFHAAPHQSYRARVVRLEGADQARWVMLLVEGTIPSDVVALDPLLLPSMLGGEPITLMGFPCAEGSMWTVTRGTLLGQMGRTLVFSGTVDEGNLGGPVLFKNNLVGIVTWVGDGINTAELDWVVGIDLGGSRVPPDVPKAQPGSSEPQPYPDFYGQGAPSTSKREKTRMPAFPWPPPPTSAETTIPRNWLPATAATKLADVAEKIEVALAQAEYPRWSYSSVPNGFALVSQMEQIKSDGTPSPVPARWTTRMPEVVNMTLVEFIKALANAEPGYYRVIVFIVTNQPWPRTGKEATGKEAEQWLAQGFTWLPTTIGMMTYGADYRTTVLVYEFKKLSQDVEATFLTPSLISADLHLEKAGISDPLSRR